MRVAYAYDIHQVSMKIQKVNKCSLVNRLREEKLFFGSYKKDKLNFSLNVKNVGYNM